MVKRFLMIQLWRIQQSYTLLSLFLWGLVISFTAYPIISPVWLPFLERQFGISAGAPGVVAGTLLLLFLGIYAVLYLFGVVYDKYLKLWREQLDVAVERNPYAREKLTAKEILQWRHMFLPTLRAAAPGDKGAEREIEFMDKWIALSLASDAVIRRSLEDAEREILGTAKGAG